jgi:hypothetical protein
VSVSFSNGVVEGVMTHKFITWSKDGFDPGASQELQRAGSGPATDSASLPFQAPARFSCRNGAHMWGRDDVQKCFAITQSGISYSVIDRTVHLSLVGNFNKHQTYL